MKFMLFCALSLCSGRPENVFRVRLIVGSSQQHDDERKTAAGEKCSFKIVSEQLRYSLP